MCGCVVCCGIVLLTYVDVRYGGSFCRICGGSFNIRDVGDNWRRNVMLIGIE
jgi:hypothetical protein